MHCLLGASGGLYLLKMYNFFTQFTKGKLDELFLALTFSKD